MAHSLTFLLLFLVNASAQPSSTDCPSPGGVRLTEAQMNPTDFHSYLKTSGLRDPGDIVCCLPKSYLKNFTIVHSSESAQKSDVDRPRVIFHNDLEPKGPIPTRPIQMLVTINGGGEDLSNSQNVETMYNNVRAGEAELYDLDLSHGKLEITKNSEACLRCHGDRGQMPAGGPKTILEDTDQWTHLVQGVHGCEPENELSRAIERRVQKAFRTNPRYRCVDQAVASKDHFSGRGTSIAKDILPLHNALSAMNARRFARYLRTTRGYDAYKYLILGTLLCSKPYGSFDGIQYETTAFSKWLPPELSKTLDSTAMISSDLRGPGAIEKVHAQLTRSERDMRRAQAKIPNTIHALDHGQVTDIEFYKGPLASCDGTTPVNSQMADLKAALKGPAALDLFKMDSMVRGARGSHFNPAFRWALEGRGIAVDGFSMEPAPESYPNMPSNLDDELMELEPSDSPIGEIYAEFRRVRNQETSATTDQDEESSERTAKTFFERTCTKLENLSREAIAKLRKPDVSKEATRTAR